MTKPLKLLAGLLPLAVLAVLALALLIDPNDYRGAITARIAAATGHELSIAGDLELSLFPRLAIRIGEASIASPAAFADEPIMQAARIELHARLLPLLSRRLVVERVRIEGLRVHLIRDTDGATNWQRPPPSSLAAGVLALGSPAPAKGAQPVTLAAAVTPLPPPEGPSNTDEPAASMDVILDAVEVVDAVLLWDDRMRHRRLALQGLGVSAGPVRPGEPMDLRLAGVTHDLAPGVETRVSAQARVPIGTEPIRIEGIELGLDAGGGPLGQVRLTAEGRAAAVLDLPAGTLHLSDIELRSGDLSLSGELTAEQLAVEPVLTGHLALTELDLRAWLGERQIALPPMADAETLRRVALSLGWRLAAGRLDAEGIELRLDQTQVRGSATRLPGPTPGYRFALAGDQLDLDRYLPPPAQTSPTAAAPSATAERAAPSPGPLRTQLTVAEPMPLVKTAAAGQPAAAATGPSPASPIAGRYPLDVDGRLRVEELRLARLLFGEADLHLRAQDGQLRLDNHIGRFYQGRLDGQGGLDLRGGEPTLTLSQHATGVALAPLLTDLTGSAPLTGHGDAEADLSARGESREALLRTATGHIALALRDGQVQGFDLEGIIRSAEAHLGPVESGRDPSQRTMFTQLTASARVDGGVLHNDDLLATSDYLQVTGQGRIDLPAERLDYRFEPVFVRPPQGRGIKELEGIPIPVRLTGSFDRPEWNVDLAAALRAAGQRRLERELDREDGALRRLEEGTGIKGLEQGLRRLFQR